MTTPHPLDPLSGDEVTIAVELLRRVIDPSARFVSVETREPDKAQFVAWRDHGGPIPAREAFIVGIDRRARRGLEATVALGDQPAVVSLTVLGEGVRPPVLLEEFVAAGEAALADPAVQAALAARGITDPSTVHPEAWSVGSSEPNDRRLARVIMWRRDGSVADNVYARPLFGLIAVIDLDEMQVVRVDDHAPGTPPPTRTWPYHDAGGTGEYRQAATPLHITQPDGPSFTLDGRHLQWQNWDLRVGFHPREGLVLHEIAYLDCGRRRQICHRASIAELVIPYGDPNPTVQFKNVFDTGEYGLGPLTNSLSLGCDCVGEVSYLDVVANDPDGNVHIIAQGICIHEEDDNILWKHTDPTGRVDRARSRRLVISSFATVGNYEYGYFWYFHLDGSWAFEAKLTGIVHTAGTAPGAPRSAHSLPLGDGIVTSGHQHFFCARLDFDIDGEANDAGRVDYVADPPGPENPHGTAFREVTTLYPSESTAGVGLSAATARRFRVWNRSRLNRIGDPVAYELVPGDNVEPMAHPDSAFRQRANMLDHHAWVTPYARAERYPCGEYPYQSAGGDGLRSWTSADRNLADTDVVFWYVFGAHHFPRLEDWPVMPVAKVGFHLRPVGFFDHNPALDVPPPAAACHAPTGGRHD